MKPIRDRAGNVVAYEHDANANRRELRSKSNGLLAWYDKNTDRTHDWPCLDLVDRVGMRHEACFS